MGKPDGKSFKLKKYVGHLVYLHVGDDIQIYEE